MELIYDDENIETTDAIAKRVKNLPTNTLSSFVVKDKNKANSITVRIENYGATTDTSLPSITNGNFYFYTSYLL